MKAPPQTHTHTQQATRTNAGGLGSGGGGNLAGLRLERLGSIPGSSRICSRGRQVGLSFPSGPIPGEGVKVTAAVQPESLRAGVRTWSGPQGALTDRPPLLHAERKSRRYRTSDPDSKARIYLQGPQTSGLPGPPEPRVGARPGRLGDGTWREGDAECLGPRSQAGHCIQPWPPKSQQRGAPLTRGRHRHTCLGRAGHIPPPRDPLAWSTLTQRRPRRAAPGPDAARQRQRSGERGGRQPPLSAQSRVSGSLRQLCALHGPDSPSRRSAPPARGAPPPPCLQQPKPAAPAGNKASRRARGAGQSQRAPRHLAQPALRARRSEVTPPVAFWEL